MIMPVLAVNDVEASIAYYTQVLGFTEAFRMPDETGATYFAAVTLGSGIMYGLSRQTELTVRGQGVAFMNYIPHEDIDAYFAEVCSRGADVKEEIRDEYWGDRVFAIADPDGFYHMMAKTVRQVSPEELGGS